MPHGNKKSSSTNNKKKRANRSTGSASTANSSSGGSDAVSGGVASSSSNSSNHTRRIPNWTDFPDWSISPNYVTSSSRTTTSSNATFTNSNKTTQPLSTIYQRYKQATERFKDVLLQLVPSISTSSASSTTSSGTTNQSSHISVQTLVEAVDYLREQQEQDDEEEHVLRHQNPDVLLQMMEDLKTAIFFRQRVSLAYYRSVPVGGGSNTNSYDTNEGHNYFIQVLNYCWITLKPIVRYYCSVNNTSKKDASSSRNQANKTKKDDDDDLDPMRNRFSALSVDDVLDDTNTIDPITRTSTTPLARPVPNKNKEYTLHDLTHGDDYFCAQMFLISMDEMMQFVSVFYSTLKRAWRTHTDREIPSDTFVEDIMEAAVYVNFSIQQIMMMEEELQTKYPYLNTVYRMMVFLIYPGWIKEFTDSIIEHVSNPTKFLASRDAIALMGDLVECGFRNPSDRYSHTDPIVTTFCRKWKVDPSKIHRYVEVWKLICRFEAPLRPERQMNQQSFGRMTDLGLQSHSWLAQFKYIGGQDRCMMNTIRMLQGLSNVVKKGQPLILKRGFFGRQWDEARKKATKICEDMDELLMGDLLPTLLSMCTDGLLSMKLPRESELLTFFTVLKSFTRSPEKAVPWSLAFAVHALLTSFFEMQGHNDIEKLGRMAKSSWDTYIQQIQSLVERNDDDVQAKIWRPNLKMVHSLRWLVSPVHNQGVAIEERAVWNPLCAGLFMQFICFFANLECGMAMIDSFAQLRMVLHLYNAFVQVGALESGGLPFLDWLQDTFKDCKAVWEGPIPKKGEFVKRWWIAYGSSIQNAQQLATATHARLRGNDRSNMDTIRPPPRMTYRDMTPINPEDIAECFRRVCLHDFAGIEDKYHTDAQRQRSAGSMVYELAVRSNATMDTMENEQLILASNFIVIGSQLNAFIVQLFDVLEWTPYIDRIIATTPDSIKAGRRVNGTSVHPNSWEASDTNLRRLGMVTMLAEQLLGSLDVVPDLTALATFNPDRSLPRAAAFLHYFQEIRTSENIFFTPTAFANDNDANE